MEDPIQYMIESQGPELPADRLQQAIAKMEPFRDVIQSGEKVKVVINFAGDRCRVNIEYWEPKVV